MIQIIEQTDEEKTAMYMKCNKAELVMMLIECNKRINQLVKPNGSYAILGPPDVSINDSTTTPHIKDAIKWDWKK